jgi:hypothetical protein
MTRIRLHVLLVGIAALWAGFVSAAAGPMAPSPMSRASEQGFVKNAGQLQGVARYYAIGENSAVFFEPSSVVLDHRPTSPLERGVALRVEFPGAHARPKLEVGEPSESRRNAFLGSDPSRWRTGVATYGEVRYVGVASGADLVYRMADGRLKYDLVLAPGAELSKAVLRYRGAESLSIDGDGGLVVHSGTAELREEPVFMYQEIGGQRVVVRGGYRVVSGNEFGFWAASYDRSLPLVVDPGLMWSSFVGGNGTDYLHAVATDASGNVYVVGMTNSTNYPVTSGAYQSTMAGGNDVVVTKLKADGSGAMWSTCLGGSGNEEANGVVVDANGNVYVCGYTYSSDFPVTSGAFRTTHTDGRTDPFVTKLSPSGGTLVYSTYLGGDSDDQAVTIAVNSSGEAVVGGSSGSSNFPTTPGVVKPTFSPNFLNGADGFVTKLNAAGSGLVYSTFVGSNSGTESVSGVALDVNGLAVLVGATLSTDFPTTAGAFDQTHNGDWDCVVAKLNSGATAYLFSTFLGGSGSDEGYGVAVDGAGYVYVTGRTMSPEFPVTSGAVQRNYRNGPYDAFVTKLNPDGRALSYSTYLGGTGADYGRDVVVSAGGQACVAGLTLSTDFPTTSGAFQTTTGGGWDAFTTTLSATGSSLAYSSYLGGSGSEAAHGLALKPNGQAVLVGLSDSANYPTTSGAFDRTQNSPGAYDGFVASVDVGLASPLAVAPPWMTDLDLAGPAPNPFSTETTINLSLARAARVTIRVLDVQGRVIRQLANAEFAAGAHRVAWDGRDAEGRDVGAGRFIMDLAVDGSRRTKTIVHLR